MTDEEEIISKDFVPSGMIPHLFPNLWTENQWSWSLRNRKETGMESAVRYLGGRIIIHLPSLRAWLNGENEATNE